MSNGAAVYAEGGGRITIGDNSKITSTGERNAELMPDLYYNVGVRADGYYIEPPLNPRNILVSDAQPISIPSNVTLGDGVSIYTDGGNSNMGIFASNRAVVTLSLIHI